MVVSWNTRELLARCLGSIERERDRAGLTVETIVVDNASRDGSAAMVGQHFPDARLIALDENRGFAAANNRALAEAAGGAVLLLNPDAELADGALAALWRVFHAMPHVGLVGPLLLNPDGSTQSAGYDFPGLAQTLIDLWPVHPRLVASRLNGRVTRHDGLSPIAIDHPLGACMLARRAVVEEVGGLDEGYFMYSEEIDWCRRIRAAGWTILLAPAARVVHHGGQSSGQAPETMFLALHRSRARYLRRYERAWVRPVASRAAGLAAWTAGRRGRPERARALEAVSRIYREASDG